MSKHTPGPWKVTVNGINSPDGHLVFFDVSGGPHESDARLIEAAPDLLAALMKFNVLWLQDNPHAAAWVEQANAAIAKAEGVTLQA